MHSLWTVIFFFTKSQNMSVRFDHFINLVSNNISCHELLQQDELHVVASKIKNGAKSKYTLIVSKLKSKWTCHKKESTK